MTSSAITMDITAQDISGQTRTRARGIVGDTSIRELVQRLLHQMRLVRKDVGGHPLEYRARLEREGRHLADSEIVADALQPGDEITLQPRINAG